VIDNKSELSRVLEQMFPPENRLHVKFRLSGDGPTNNSMSFVESGRGSQPKEVYEFGSFRLDIGKRLVDRAGQPIALTPKTFQLLLVLVRHKSEVVTKDELMKAVWPDTFVEETNLTRNIFALRKALGETDDDPYVITVPGQGYRFAKDIRALTQRDEISVIAASTSTVQVQVEDRNFGRSLRWMVPAGVLLLLAAGFVFRSFHHDNPVLTEKDTVMLGEFENSTGDPVFDGTLREGMAVQLEQSPILRFISEQRMRRTLVMMGQPQDSPLTGERAREVCERAGGAAVIAGSIAMLGSEYVLGVRAINCHTGSVLDEEQEQVARKEDVLNGLSQIANRFRVRVGESLGTVEKNSTPLAEATTGSLEALKAYSAGWQVHGVHGASAALPFFKRATELDPQFAMAYASLGRLYADLDQRGLASANLTQAWQLRSRASERERFFIVSNYQILATGNLEAAQMTGEAWARSYPRDGVPHHLLSGIVHKAAGRYEEGLREAKIATELEPDFWVGHYNIGVNNQYLGRLDEAAKALQAAVSRGLDSDEFVMLTYDLDFLHDDQAGMEHEAAQARARPGGENWMSARESLVAATSGHLREARAISRRAVIQAQQAGQPERAALWEVGAAIREAFFGNKEPAKNGATSALKLSRDQEIEYGAGLAFAISGDSKEATALADDLEKRFPEDSSIRFNYLPTIRAIVALNGGNEATALQSLEVARPHELGIPPSGVSGLFGALYPIYIRGLALLATGKPDEAAAEFQNIIDHRSIVVSDPVGVLAQLQIARAYAASGDKVKAKGGYEGFLSRWKDADSDIPILSQAKNEYSKLR
jgi:DNA-binding winged helix-turn-helix (wHTH) protein/tetratricopeptide (TPR) repeat protein